MAYENLSGTQSVDLSKTRWRLPGIADEEGVFYINELNELVMLKEPKSWKAIQRISDQVIREKWEAACKAEMDGIKQQGVYKLVDRGRPPCWCQVHSAHLGLQDQAAQGR